MLLTRRQQWELVLVATLAVLVAAAAVAAGRFSLVSGKRADVLYDQTYDKMQGRVTLDHRIEGDWQATRKGLALGPGQSGTVTLAIQNDPQGRLVMFLFGRGRPGVHLALAVSGDLKTFRDVPLAVSLDGTRIDLTRAAGPLDRVWLRLTASVGPGDSPGAPALLSRMRVVTVNPPLTFPNLPLASLLVLTPVLAYLARTALTRGGSLPFSLAVLCGLAILADAIAQTRISDPLRWWELVVVSQEGNAYFFIPYFLLVFLYGWSGRVAGTAALSEKLWPRFSLGGILIWGASSRLGRLAEVGGGRLDPDALTYMQLAESLQQPYDTMYREPLWIWMIKGWLWLVGSSPLNLRLLTLLLSLVVIAAAYRVFRDYTGRPLVGLLVALLMAVNPYLIGLSVRGLREETYILSILLFMYPVLIRGCRLSAATQAIWLAVAGTALHLLRFNSYLFVAPLLALWAWRQAPGSRRYVLMPLLVIAVASAPHLEHNYQKYGDPFYSVNVHFVWSRNYEFVLLKQTGCPGCPTREEIEADSTVGPIVGAREYLFGLHTVREVAERTWRGYRDMYLLPTPLFEMQSGTASGFGYALYLVGLLLVLTGVHREMLAVILLLANGVPFAITLDIDPRIGIHTAPFVAFVLAYGIARSLEAVMALREQARAPSPSILVVPGAARRGGWG